jgi:GxxExxY protein
MTQMDADRTQIDDEETDVVPLKDGAPRKSDVYPELSEKIIGAAFAVQRELGCGFLEKVYENALVYELRSLSLRVTPQAPIAVKYKGVAVGMYFPDILVEGRVVVEIKAVEALAPIHEAQILHYLKATGIELGLLLNFATPRVQIRRFANSK